MYAAGTTTPQLGYRDAALALPHPNPVTLASDGRIPPVYFADGSIRCRLLNSAGVVQFDYDNLLVIGASSGGAVGTVIDPNAIYTTGDVMWLDVSGTRSGWVRDNGRTIGSATSGASERANSDCQLLFLYLWGTYSDTLCPVVTGRGATAAADWGANKQITLPDKRGYVPGGLTDMGNSDSSRLASVPFSVGSATAAGSLCGEARHTLSIAEMPSHDHGGSATPAIDGGSSANIQYISPSSGSSGFAAGSSSIHNGSQMSVSIGAQGGGSLHNNTGLVVLGTYFRKL